MTEPAPSHVVLASPKIRYKRRKLCTTQNRVVLAICERLAESTGGEDGYFKIANLLERRGADKRNVLRSLRTLFAKGLLVQTECGIEVTDLMIELWDT